VRQVDMGGREEWCIEMEELESQVARMGVGRLPTLFGIKSWARQDTV
jgi:hypothetical protein